MLYDYYYREQIQLEEFHGPKRGNFNAWRKKTWSLCQKNIIGVPPTPEAI